MSYRRHMIQAAFQRDKPYSPMVRQQEDLRKHKANLSLYECEACEALTRLDDLQKTGRCQGCQARMYIYD